MPQVPHFDWRSGRLTNLLHRNALPDRECSTQGFMTADDFGAAVAKDLHVQWATNAERKRNIVKIAGRLKLLQKPEALLGKGARQMVRTGNRTNSGRSCSFAASKQLLDGPRLIGNGGPFKNAAQRQGRAQNRAHSRSNLQGQQ